MIAKFFIIFAFIRSMRCSRRRNKYLNNNEDHERKLESKDKLSSLNRSVFSRSDSSATTASSSGSIYMGGKRRGDSTASTISTSVFSENMQMDVNSTIEPGRRSSEGTRLQQPQHRRSSGRTRRIGGSRTTMGVRRRTTGRFVALELTNLFTSTGVGVAIA